MSAKRNDARYLKQAAFTQCRYRSHVIAGVQVGIENHITRLEGEDMMLTVLTVLKQHPVHLYEVRARSTRRDRIGRHFDRFDGHVCGHLPVYGLPHVWPSRAGRHKADHIDAITRIQREPLIALDIESARFILDKEVAVAPLHGHGTLDACAVPNAYAVIVAI